MDLAVIHLLLWLFLRGSLKAVFAGKITEKGLL